MDLGAVSDPLGAQRNQPWTSLSNMLSGPPPVSRDLISRLVSVDFHLDDDGSLLVGCDEKIENAHPFEAYLGLDVERAVADRNAQSA
jgi:hypothetical protein